ncbi:MAG: glycosyltransferase [Chloroflexota bacterium]
MIERLSVIIPTRNRADSLKALLDSINNSELSDATEIEVIVVNNGSTDRTNELLAGETKLPRRHRLMLLEENRPGKSRAINRGLDAARGEILMIVDDDVTVDSHCLAKHIDAHERGDFAAIQGKVLPGKDPEGRDADPRRLREYNIPLIDYGPEIVEIRGLTGTNMSFQRKVLQAVGRFDIRLGPGASGFSEDTEFSIRVREAGFKIGYTPHAIVYHELNPGRYGRAYNRDVQYRKGFSRSLYRHDPILFKVFPNLLANCFRFGIYRLLGLSQKAYKTEGRMMKCCGYLVGKFSQRKRSAGRDTI